MKHVTYTCTHCGKKLEGGRWETASWSFAGNGLFGRYSGEYCDYNCIHAEFALFRAGEHPKQTEDHWIRPKPLVA